MSVSSDGFIVASLIAYLIGSIPFGIILTKIFTKQNLREIGSGNIGATNVLRTGNKKLALMTLLLDSSKGAVAVYIITGTPHFSDPNNPFVNAFDIPFNLHFTNALIISLFAIIGHCFPVWLKFKGGKGVATSLGALLASVPYAGLAACGVWIIVAKFTKISSLAALLSVGVAPIVTLFVYGSTPAIICTLISALVWIRHKDNIKRLLNGTEPKIGASKKNLEQKDGED